MFDKIKCKIMEIQSDNFTTKLLLYYFKILSDNKYDFRKQIYVRMHFKKYLSNVKL